MLRHLEGVCGGYAEGVQGVCVRGQRVFCTPKNRVYNGSLRDPALTSRETREL